MWWFLENIATVNLLKDIPAILAWLGCKIKKPFVATEPICIIKELKDTGVLQLVVFKSMKDSIWCHIRGLWHVTWGRVFCLQEHRRPRVRMLEVNRLQDAPAAHMVPSAVMLTTTHQSAFAASGFANFNLFFAEDRMLIKAFRARPV